MKAYKQRGKGGAIGDRASFVCYVMVLLFTVGIVRADVIFDSGYNTYDESYGYNYEVWAINDAILDVFGGQIGKLEYDNNARGSIYSGTMDWLWTDDNAVVNIYGASFNIIASRPESTVCLYAYDTIYHPNGGLNNQPWLEGTYLMGEIPFSFTFDSVDSVPQLTIVPEPITFLLLGFGGIMIRNRKK